MLWYYILYHIIFELECNIIITRKRTYDEMERATLLRAVQDVAVSGSSGAFEVPRLTNSHGMAMTKKCIFLPQKWGKKTCFDRGIDVCFYFLIVSGHFQKQFQPCTPMNIQILYRFFNSENLSRSTEWTCCHMSSGMLWPCKYPKALLWHVVYEEEIGSVKGHIGPLILGHRDAAVTHSVGKTTRMENLQIRACSADEWSQFETQRHDAFYSEELLSVVQRRCWICDRWWGWLCQSAPFWQGLLHCQTIWVSGTAESCRLTKRFSNL